MSCQSKHKGKVKAFISFNLKEAYDIYIYIYTKAKLSKQRIRAMEDTSFSKSYYQASNRLHRKPEFENGNHAANSEKLALV